MTTFEKVIESVAGQLDQRGLLLNLQIAQLTKGDESLLRKVRDSLTAAGVAEDRFGMGLARIGKPGVCLAALKNGRLKSPDEIVFAVVPESTTGCMPTALVGTAETGVPDWWVMTRGTVRGPHSIQQLTGMLNCNELRSSDLLRQGNRGIWLRLDEVNELATAPSTVPAVIHSESPGPVDLVIRQENGIPRPAIASDSSVTGFNAPAATSNAGSLSETSHSIAPNRRSEQPTRTDACNRKPSGTDPNVSPYSAVVTQRPTVTFSGNSPPAQNSQSSIETRGSSPRKTVRQFAVGNQAQQVLQLALDVTISVLRTVLPDVGNRVAGGVRVTVRSGILIPVFLMVAVVGIWWIWPPSSRSIFTEFDKTHQRVTELKESRKSDSQLKTALEPDRARIDRLVKILEQRATETPSIHRELLLAGKHALLVIIDYPRKSDIFEGMFDFHMNQARQLLKGVSIDEAISKSPRPVPGSATISIPSGTAAEATGPREAE